MAGVAATKASKTPRLAKLFFKFLIGGRCFMFLGIVGFRKEVVGWYVCIWYYFIAIGRIWISTMVVFVRGLVKNFMNLSKGQGLCALPTWYSNSLIQRPDWMLVICTCYTSNHSVQTTNRIDQMNLDGIRTPINLMRVFFVFICLSFFKLFSLPMWRFHLVSY